MKNDRTENYANRGGEIIHLYFGCEVENGVYSGTITETLEQDILPDPIGKINPDMDKFKLH